MYTCFLPKKYQCSINIETAMHDLHNFYFTLSYFYNLTTVSQIQFLSKLARLMMSCSFQCYKRIFLTISRKNFPLLLMVHINFDRLLNQIINWQKIWKKYVCFSHSPYNYPNGMQNFSIFFRQVSRWNPSISENLKNTKEALILWK